MRIVFETIARRRRVFAEHPFIRFLHDDTVPARQRLTYAPFGAYFVLAFGEFNRDVLPSTEDSPEQEMVNRHAAEDEKHYAWFLNDLEILGFDPTCRFTDVLRFLWSDEGRHARELSLYVNAVTRGASASLRLVIIEALEAQGNVWLTATAHAASTHPDRERLLYFSPHHLERETGHAIGSEVEQIQSIVLEPALQLHAEQIIHGIFDRTEAFCDEMLRRTRKACEGDPSDFLSL